MLDKAEFDQLWLVDLANYDTVSIMKEYDPDWLGYSPAQTMDLFAGITDPDPRYDWTQNGNTCEPVVPIDYSWLKENIDSSGTIFGVESFGIFPSNNIFELDRLAVGS